MGDALDRSGLRSSTLIRRLFIEAMAGWFGALVVGQAPVFAQTHELCKLTWNPFVPASDERLKELAAEFGKCPERHPASGYHRIPATASQMGR